MMMMAVNCVHFGTFALRCCISTRCQMNLEIQTVSIVLNGSLFSSAATSVTSTLEVIYNEMCYINLCFTYLLAYLIPDRTGVFGWTISGVRRKTKRPYLLTAV